jgi:hypothetical protein
LVIDPDHSSAPKAMPRCHSPALPPPGRPAMAEPTAVACQSKSSRRDAPLPLSTKRVTCDSDSWPFQTWPPSTLLTTARAPV